MVHLVDLNKNRQNVVDRTKCHIGDKLKGSIVNLTKTKKNNKYIFTFTNYWSIYERMFALKVCSLCQLMPLHLKFRSLAMQTKFTFIRK